MGFLNHSTNNIIIDAVLTEKGRELLSKNNNSFEITSFAFGDDEVDYSTITKYGKVIGKEKIEKNTPIFEAITDEYSAIKFPVLNITGAENLQYMPKIVDSDSSKQNYSIASNSQDNSGLISAIIQFKTSISGVTSSFTLNSLLKDDEFSISMNRKLLSLTNNSNSSISGLNIIYTVDSTTPANTEFTNQRTGKIEVTTSGDFNADMYDLYGSSDDVIRTQILITGNRSGASLIIPVHISLNGNL
tara:strand:- start:1679 stop:2413 length:735 start_codon:yes stop_codon:yes gene_type:complete